MAAPPRRDLLRGVLNSLRSNTCAHCSEATTRLLVSQRPASLLARALLLALALAGCLSPARPEVRGVVLVVVDTLRADHLGAYGYPRATTPELDRWAARGVLFEKALAPSPWTLPSFASILTGRYPSGHGAGTRREESAPGSGRRFSALDPGVASLPEVLAREGYATAALLTNTFLDPEFGLDRGFDTYDQTRNRFLSTRRVDVLMDRALEWLEENHSRPFFLMVQVLDPHLPYDPPEDVRGEFTAGYDGPLPNPLRLRFGQVGKIRSGEWSLDPADEAFITGAYDEEIRFVDRHLGRFLDTLAARGLLREALVVVTSDHGEELFDHRSFEHGHTLYQELLRVPLLLLGPVPEGQRVPVPVSLVDLAPTVLDALGHPELVAGDGISLWPTVLAPGRRPPPRRPLLAEAPLYGPQRHALIQWPYKLIHNPETGHTRLFDLERDPGERHNLKDREPRRLQELLTQLRGRLDGASSGEPVDLGEGVREGLRALGYLE